METAEQSSHWHIDEITYDLHHSEFLKDNIMTEYESRFVAEGKPICRLLFHVNKKEPFSYNKEKGSFLCHLLFKENFLQNYTAAGAAKSCFTFLFV